MQVIENDSKVEEPLTDNASSLTKDKTDESSK